MILSYLLFTRSINEYINTFINNIVCSIMFKNKYEIYNYLYKNLIHLYGVSLSIYSVSTENYVLFINSIIYPLLYNILIRKLKFKIYNFINIKLFLTIISV